MKSVETADCRIATGQEKIAFITNEELWSRARLASEVNRLGPDATR